jgi:hypothetical protein
VLLIGRPIGTPAASPSATTQRCALDHTLHSVGPYSLTSGTPGKSSPCRRTSAAGHASPATITVRSALRAVSPICSSSAP